MYDRNTRERDEVLLISSLSEDAGTEPLFPDSREERFRIIRSLMNVRPPAHVDGNVLDAQDRYLRNIISEKGITDAGSLDFKDGMCLWRGDITTLRCDAIVNAANDRMLGCFAPCHGCIDNAIHTFAGMQLRQECFGITGGARVPTAEAYVTGGYNLPAGYVIHVAGPVVDGPLNDSHRRLLRESYRSCLEAAASVGAETLAFCCISTGVYGFPKRDAAEIAVDEVEMFLHDHDMEVVFDVFTDEDMRIYAELLG